jgi:hypothetical protein
MMTRLFLSLALLIQLSSTALPAETAGNATIEPGAAFAGADKSDIWRSVLQDPKTINKTLQTLLAADNPLKKFLDAADIKFKAFDSDKPGKEKSLGFSYDFNRDFTRYYISDETARHDGLSLNLSAKGNVAFDKAANPRDFLDSKVLFLGFCSRGGVIRTTDEVALRLNDLEDAAAKIKTREELLRDPNMVELLRIFRENMTTQYYCELAADGGIESDQSFSQKQYTYGGHLAFDIKGWSPDSPWARFNIFDYPFAATRLVLQNDKVWSPRGSAFPTVMVGVDEVMPTGDDPRAMVGDKGDFPRFKVQAGYRTLVGHINGEAAFFEANVRYYQELGAAAAVKAASLDHATVFTAVLLLPKGTYVSYSTGRLPFDVKDSQVYELGFHYKF